MQPTVSRATTVLVDGSNQLWCNVYINRTNLRAMKGIHITLLMDMVALLVISSVAYRDEGYPDSKFAWFFVAHF